MVKVNLESIMIFDLPLNTREKVLKKDREELKRVKAFQKKYCKQSNEVCAAWSPSSSHYGNVAYNYIPYEIRKQWVSDFENIVRSSFIYKVWIFVYMFIRPLDKL